MNALLESENREVWEKAKADFINHIEQSMSYSSGKSNVPVEMDVEEISTSLERELKLNDEQDLNGKHD